MNHNADDQMIECKKFQNIVSPNKRIHLLCTFWFNFKYCYIMQNI